MAVLSRNPQEFLERYGLSRAHFVPRPRLNLGDFKINSLPLQDPLPEPSIRQEYEGEPPPDRGLAHGWPNQDPTP